MGRRLNGLEPRFGQRFVMAIGLAISSNLFAAIQTLNYISLDAKPLYANLSAMPYANPNAPKGGSVVLPATGTFDNFNSMNGKGSSADGVQYLYDGLMKNSLDEAGVAYPLLAQSITYDPDKPKYAIFHINPKARFSNGSPVTAKDVEFTFKKLLSEGAPGLRMYFADVAEIRAISKYDVRFDFKTDENKEMPIVVATVPIFSEHDLKNKDFTKVSMQAPLGSGAYVVAKIDAGRAITYKRNPNYWGKDLPVNKGAYNFDQIKYIYYRTLDIAFEGFKTGQYTVHREMTSRRWAIEYDFNAVKAGMIKKMVIKNHNPIPTQSFVFNTRKAPLNDIYFRQALSYAYDFEWMNKALFYGNYQRLQSYFDNSELAGVGKPSPAELTVLTPYLKQLSAFEQKKVLSDWTYPVTDASGFNRQNLLLARQILLSHGYKFNPQGKLLDKKGQPIAFEFLIHQDGLQRTLMPFIRNAKRLGIDVSIRSVDVPQYLERKRKYDYDLTTNVLPQSLNPGNEQLRFWSSSAADEEGNYNFSGIKNPVIDRMIDKLIRSKNRDEVITHTQVLDRLLRAGFYQIITYGKGVEWYATWDMYEQPKVQPKLDIGLDYWWTNATKAQKVNQYLKRQ
jgi:ABC-type oligopeptide transport system substrate-binding subunit